MTPNLKIVFKFRVTHNDVVRIYVQRPHICTTWQVLRRMYDVVGTYLHTMRYRVRKLLEIQSQENYWKYKVKVITNVITGNVTGNIWRHW